MSVTTPPRPVDVLDHFPELREHSATATRLHPRPGEPTAADSSVGGPLLWPADEPWPVCADGAAHDAGGPRVPARRPVPMIPVAQLYRRDVPDFAGPAGTDLLQVLWCPLRHPDLMWNPRVRLRWRAGADVTRPLDAVPAPAAVEEEHVPVPCVVRPEQVREYQYGGLLPADLDARITAWERDTGVSYQYDLSLSPGWKVGGFANWSLTEGRGRTCAACGAAMTLLFTAASCEWDLNVGWRPVEEPDAPQNPVGVTIGRGHALYVFRCPASFAHPPAIDMQ
jgi:hypothetical protein